MSLNVEYVFKVLDRFSGPLDRIGRSVEKTRDRMSRLADSAKKLGQNMAKVGAVMSASMTLPIVLMGKRFIQAASDAEETRSKFATVFKDIGQDAENTADKFAKSYGLAGTSARKFLGDTGDLLSGFGFSSEAALELSKRTNELALDLNSFANLAGGAEAATAAFNAALVGNTESLRSLGVVILQEDVKKKIAIMRSEGMRFATNREAKAYATLEIALKQSKNAIGDVGRTWISFANVQRRVSENNKEMSESFGFLLIPYATKAMNIIDNFQNKLLNLSDSQKKLILIIAGLVAVLGPLLVVIGLIAMSIPAVIAGFTALAVVFSPIGIAIAAITAAIGVLIFEFLKLVDMSGGVWNAIKMMVIGTASVVLDVINGMVAGVIDALLLLPKFIAGIIDKIPGVEIPVALKDQRYFSGLAEQSRIRRESSISDMIAANAARKSEQRIAVQGNVSGEMTINNNGQKTKAPLYGNLGSQGAGE